MISGRFAAFSQFGEGQFVAGFQLARASPDLRRDT
jgi:hypothetical protein